MRENTRVAEVVVARRVCALEAGEARAAFEVDRCSRKERRLSKRCRCHIDVGLAATISGRGQRRVDVDTWKVVTS